MRVKGCELTLSQQYGRGWYASFHVSGENVEAVKKAVDENMGKDIAVSVGKWTNPRSLTANAYFHVLVGKIAEAQRLGNDEVKKRLVVEYGAIKRSEDGTAIGFKLPEDVDVDEIYPYTKWFDHRVENGKRFHCYIVMKQTHTMDSAEMARLIDGTIAEAKELGIETLPPYELERMMRTYEKDAARKGA